MDSDIATDDVLRSVASLQKRLHMETAAGLAASCNEAQRQRYGLLDRKRRALAITRAKILAGDTAPSPTF